MFIRNKKDKKSIEQAIDALLAQMETYAPSSEEYAKASENLIKLTDALNNQSDAKSKVNAPLFALAGQAGVVAALLAVEKNGVLTSKIPDYVSKIIKR